MCLNLPCHMKKREVTRAGFERFSVCNLCSSESLYFSSDEISFRREIAQRKDHSTCIPFKVRRTAKTYSPGKRTNARTVVFTGMCLNLPSQKKKREVSLHAFSQYTPGMGGGGIQYRQLNFCIRLANMLNSSEKKFFSKR